MKKLNCWSEKKGEWEEGPAIELNIPGIEDSDRIISIEKGKDGFIFCEQASFHFRAILPYEIALMAIDELKNWIIDREVESI